MIAVASRDAFVSMAHGSSRVVGYEAFGWGRTAVATVAVYRELL